MFVIPPILPTRQAPRRLTSDPRPRRGLGAVRVLVAGLAAAFASLAPATSRADVGLATLELPDTGPVTVFYPTREPARELTRGRLTVRVAPDAAPEHGNRRLVMISHGSGGSPWVHLDLARALVDAGYVVALPEHHDDNWRHDGNPGPDSWKLRPAEVSRAIDAVAADPRFGPLVDTRRVGVYGMSAGGHTALSLAGGRWSPKAFARHCEANLDDDFQACVGLITQLRGNVFDGIKRWIALSVIRSRFDDDTPQSHHDPRIAAVVAAVPAAADFDMASLADPPVPLAIVTAAQDTWLHPRFHADRVLAACRACVHLADLPTGGHGAYLSPLPPGLTGLVGELLNDPPGFDRTALPAIDRRIVGFFDQHLAGPATPAAQASPE